MSELNETVNVTVDDATVITVPLVTNLTATNAAPTAKTVGDALASKVDTDSIMEHVTVKVNNEQSDNQGQILIDGTGIPITEGSATTIAGAVEAVDGKTGADIVYDPADTAMSIKAKVDAINTTLTEAVQTVDAKTGESIAMGASDARTIKAAVDALATAIEGIDTGTDNVKYTAQTLDDTQKGVARTNIGAGAAADVAAIQAKFTNKFTEDMPYVAMNVSGDYPIPIVDSGYATRYENACALWRFGPFVMVTFAFQINSAVPVGSRIVGFYDGYPIAAGVLPLSWMIAADGTTVIALYRDGEGLATGQIVQPGFYRGYLLYGLNSSVWPIAT